ncbi:MAG: MBL fold metallo-hydrolase [Candidatus Hydrogenedentes bacterium]|nr:MBL fold metallo-hydrolase [Candidatus Hydrogenedentota bacterium]
MNARLHLLTTYGLRRSATLVLAVLLGSFAAAEEQRPAADAIDPNLDAKGNAYMNRQAKALLGAADETLKRIPPQWPEPAERRLSLLVMDGVLHDKYAQQRPAVQEFFHARIRAAVAQMEQTQVKDGAKIWKFYDMGFVVRTASVTIGFDLTRATSARAEGFFIPEDVMTSLIRQCDVLFISHRHGDHAEEWVAQTFLDQGKPVVTPPEVWEGKPIHEKITHLERDAEKMQTLPIQKGSRELKVVCYPGHQMENVQNNVPLIFTPDGISVCHIGDQINEGTFMVDYAWIDNVAKHHQVDIFLPNCWTNELFRIVKGFDPELVIMGHENELGHPVDDRVPYWGDAEFLQLTNPQLLKSNYPVVPMTWGESYSYTPKRPRK